MLPCHRGPERCADVLFPKARGPRPQFRAETTPRPGHPAVWPAPVAFRRRGSFFTLSQELRHGYLE